MSEGYHHGPRVQETTDVSTRIKDIPSSVIGLVCTADDADAVTFPLNTPVLITRVLNVLGKTGTTGTLGTTLKAISDLASPRIIVIRVPEAAEPEEGADPGMTQDQLTIGGTNPDGSFTGLYALLSAESRPGVGLKPRILAAPGLDTQPVASVLAVIAKKLCAFAYVAAAGCNSVAEATTYRENFSARELMVIWPNFVRYDSQSGENVVVPAPAHAAGMRAKIDAELGWHKTISNVPVDGVIGMDRDIYFSLQGEDTDTDVLNEAGVTTLIRQNGWRFWGSRTCDSETFIFESYTRTAQIMADTIAEAHFPYVDKPLTPSLVRDVVDGINKKIASLVTAGRLLGGRCWYDAEPNTTETLSDGKLTIKYNYTPVPPLEDLTLVQEFTDEYFAVFAGAINS